MINNSASMPDAASLNAATKLAQPVPAWPFKTQVKPQPAPPQAPATSTEPEQTQAATAPVDATAAAGALCGQPTPHFNALVGGSAKRRLATARKAAPEAADFVAPDVQPRPSAAGVAGAIKVTSVPAVQNPEQAVSFMVTALLAIAASAVAALLAFVLSQTLVQKVSSPKASASQSEAAAERKAQQQTQSAAQPAGVP